MPPKCPPPSSPSPTRRAASARPRPRSTSRRALRGGRSTRSSSTWTPRRTPRAPSGSRSRRARSLYSALRGEGDGPAAVTPTAYEHLAIIPSEEDLAAAEIELSQMDNYLMKLRGVLAPGRRLRRLPGDHHRLPARPRDALDEQPRGGRLPADHAAVRVHGARGPGPDPAQRRAPEVGRDQPGASSSAASS